jgi:cystathionine beta-synthase
MQYAENILGTIGNTPLVKLNRVIEGVDALVLRNFYPGNSVKDRMAVK